MYLGVVIFEGHMKVSLKTPEIIFVEGKKVICVEIISARDGDVGEGYATDGDEQEPERGKLNSA